MNLIELKHSIEFRLDHIASGNCALLDDFYFFQKGTQVGVAITTGEALINIHNVYPGQSYLLEGDNAIPGTPGNYLTLTCDISETDLSDPVRKEAFVNMILAFVKNENGSRAALVADPWKWAEKMIEMGGNVTSKLRPYPYIAELVLVNKLRAAGLLTDPENEYLGPDAGSHDFELATMSVECKTHLHGDSESKAGELVVSSPNQLCRTAGKPLYVVYFPMEDVGELTLEKCVQDFGSPKSVILRKLEKNGFVEGDFAWQRSYRVQGTALVYEITDDFPKITPEMFPGGHLPGAITKLIYHVSLQRQPSCPLDDFIAAKVSGRNPVFSV